MLFVGSGKYPRGGPLTRKYLLWSFNTPNASSRACIVRIPQLRDVGLRVVELVNEWEDPNTI